MTQEHFKNFKDQDISRLKEYIGSVSAPLHAATVVPDTVLIYCDGVQLTHIIHALSFEYKYTPTSSFDDFGESCIKGGLLPFVTQKPQVVIPGAGDRSFAAISENEIGIGMPGFLLFYVLENLFKTGGMMNIGYPMRPLIPSGLTEDLTPGFKFLREKMDKSKIQD